MLKVNYYEKNITLIIYVEPSSSSYYVNFFGKTIDIAKQMWYTETKKFLSFNLLK